MKKISQKMKMFSLSAILVSVAILSGCASAPQENPADGNTGTVSQQNQTMGTILLSVNPEIEIEYDDQGQVLVVEGKNDDGKKVVENYSDFYGKECQVVVRELVDEIYEEGYFDSTIEGHAKNIVVKLEKGSLYPDEAFLEEVTQGVRSSVESHQLTSSALTVDEDDYADNGYIGLDKAKELVLAQLGLTEAQFTEKEYELDDGVYELEFTANGTEYEFEVNAVTGKIMKADYEHNDDWDDKQTVETSGQNTKISVEKAKELALAKAGVKASQVTRWEKAELDDGAYDIEFKAGGKEYNVEVHAVSGKILEFDSEWDDDAGNTGSAGNSAENKKISVEKAKELALSKAGVKASQVTRWEKAELDDGTYDIEFRVGAKEYNVEVHAVSGKILEFSQEQDDDHDDD